MPYKLNPFTNNFDYYDAGTGSTVSQNLNSVLTTGNNAGSNDIDMNNKDLLNVDMNLSETAENATVTMFDINGRIIEQLNYSNVKQQNIQFNVANLSAGFYFVRIQSENGVQTKEFIKK